MNYLDKLKSTQESYGFDAWLTEAETTHRQFFMNAYIQPLNIFRRLHHELTVSNDPTVGAVRSAVENAIAELEKMPDLYFGPTMHRHDAVAALKEALDNAPLRSEAIVDHFLWPCTMCLVAFAPEDLRLGHRRFIAANHGFAKEVIDRLVDRLVGLGENADLDDKGDQFQMAIEQLDANSSVRIDVACGLLALIDRIAVASGLDEKPSSWSVCHGHSDRFA